MFIKYKNTLKVPVKLMLISEITKRIEVYIEIA